MYLDEFKKEIHRLCLINKVSQLYVFGSVLTDNFKEDSDVDLIVDIDTDDPFEYAENYFDLKFSLQELFSRPVDLLENKSIKNPYFRQNIDKNKILLYGKF